MNLKDSYKRKILQYTLSFADGDDNVMNGDSSVRSRSAYESQLITIENYRRSNRRN